MTELRDRITREGGDHKLYRYVDDLDAGYKDRTLSMINRMLSEVDYVAQTLNIESTEMSLRREVESVLSGVWVVLEGIKPEDLKGYGSLDKADRKIMSGIYDRFQKAMSSH